MAEIEEQDFLQSIIDYKPNMIGVMEAVDGDTVIHPDIDKPVRLEGYDTQEVPKWIEGEYKAGTAGGETEANVLTRLANEMGYTELRLRRDSRGRPIIDSTKKRYLGDLYNDKGQSWKRKLLSEGIQNPTKYTSQENRIFFELEQQRRQEEFSAGLYEEDEWSRAREDILAALDREGYRKAGIKLIAQDERELKYMRDMGLGNYFTDAEVVSRSGDRTLLNKALDPTKDTWNKTWVGVREASFGVVEAFGDLTHWDAVSQIGEMGVERARRQVEPYAESIQSYKDVDGFYSGLEYFTNMLAMSVPYMGITAAAYFAAPATMGASLAIPSSLYAGQTYNEMDDKNKNVGVAAISGVTQMALDMLGLRYIMKSPIASKELFQKAYKELVNKGMAPAQARQEIGRATRVSLAKFAGDAANEASKQLAAKQVFIDLIKRQAKSGTMESVTEGLQEATAYLAAHHKDIGEGVINMEELVSRTTEGMVAGAVLGGGIATMGGVQNYAGWTDVKYRLAPAHEKDLSTASMLSELEAKSKEGMKSNEENAADAAARHETYKRAGGYDTLYSEPEHLIVRTDEELARRKEQGLFEEAKERFMNPLGLFQGSVPNAISNSDAIQYRALRRLRDLLGGVLQRVYDGENFMSTKHHAVAIYKNMVAPDKMFFKEMGETGRLNMKARERASHNLINFTKKYAGNSKVPRSEEEIDKHYEKTVPKDLPNRTNLIKHAKLIELLSNKLRRDQVAAGAKMGYIPNYLFRFKAPNKRAIYKDKAEFQKLLQEEYNYTPDAAKKSTDELIDNHEVYDLDSATFSVTNQGIVPSAHRKRSLNLSENPKFDKFMDQDIYNNISQSSKQAARFIGHRKFIGENAKIINTLLHEAEYEDGAPRAKVNKIARLVKDVLDSDSGNYNRPTTEMGKKLMRLQRNFLTLSTFASLPLAAISSSVELGLVTKGLTADEIFSTKKGKDGQHLGLRGIGRELGKSIWDGTKEIADLGTQRSSDDIFSWGQQRLRELGLYDWSVGAATVTGVTETNAAQQMYFEAFFKWNGLTGITNLPRAMRASLFGDFLYNRVEEIHLHRQSGDPKTRSVQEAEQQLRDLGVRISGDNNIVDLMFDSDLIATGKDLTALNPTGEGTISIKLTGNNPLAIDRVKFKEEMLGKQVQEATFNFIRDAVALPDAANRPLFYQDPRFALFFQFQGFIATFTANHIPKLWGEYIKRGTPALKYNAFATMSTMIMLSFASQYLKDLLKYGESTPYLDDAEYYQRGIRSSGLLGTSERIIDQFMPLYDYRSGSGPSAWVFDTTTSEAPALGYAKRTLGAMRKFSEGDVGESVRLGTKLLPVVAPFNQIGNQWGKFADRWNFNNSGIE
jgi:hypothetical protein